MKTAFITHSDCLSHLTPSGHPENSDRLAVIINRLSGADFRDLKKLKAPLGKIVDICRAHPLEHIKKIQRLVPKEGLSRIDGDTFLANGSFRAALRGAGAVTKAIDLVLAKKYKNVFCATRPPGHHAEKKQAMGFCLLGNISIGAKYLLEKHNFNKVAIVDFDVHHGNGTQDIVWDEGRALFISMHQMPLFPGTGSSSEIGERNNVLNIPLKEGSDGAYATNILKTVVLPRLKLFKPEFILISAGFDAHKNDPLANLNWTTKDFGKITRLLLTAAGTLCNNRVVSSLEGGYNLDALKDSVAIHVKSLMEA